MSAGRNAWRSSEKHWTSPVHYGRDFLVQETEYKRSKLEWRSGVSDAPCWRKYASAEHRIRIRQRVPGDGVTQGLVVGCALS